MAKPSIGDVASSVMDPMLSDNFLLEIPSIPGTQGQTKTLTLQCRTVSKPGLTIENAEVAIFGHTLEYVGRKTFSHDMSVEYVENRDAVVQKMLEDWAEYCRRTQDQLGNYKLGTDGYARTAVLTIYDVKGLEKAKYKIVNVWPSSVPEIQFDGSQASVISLQVQFKYDYYERMQ